MFFGYISAMVQNIVVIISNLSQEDPVHHRFPKTRVRTGTSFRP